jgi:hypothetical protein
MVSVHKHPTMSTPTDLRRELTCATCPALATYHCITHGTRMCFECQDHNNFCDLDRMDECDMQPFDNPLNPCHTCGVEPGSAKCGKCDARYCSHCAKDPLNINSEDCFRCRDEPDPTPPGGYGIDGYM